MNNKKFLFLLIAPLILSSCSKGFIRYGVNPYIPIKLEKVGALLDLFPSKIKEKMDNKDEFVLFVHRSGCALCEYATNTIIEPYLEEYPITLYGMNTSDFSNNLDETKIYNQIIQPFSNFNHEGDRVVPYISIFNEGEFVNGELDVNFYNLFLQAYIIYEE